MAMLDKSPRRLVLSRATGDYLKKDGTWTRNEAEALNFSDVASMVALCAKYHIKDTDVVLRFNPGQKFDALIPLFLLVNLMRGIDSDASATIEFVLGLFERYVGPTVFAPFL